MGRPASCGRSSSTSTRSSGAAGASSTSTTWPACARRTTRSSRRPTGWRSPWSREGVLDGLRVDHPDGLADPAGYLRAPARRRGRAGLGREDPRARRAAARLAGHRHGRLRVPQRRLRRCSSTRPAEEPLTDALPGADRRARAVRRDRRRGQARAGDRRPSIPRSTACAGSSTSPTWSALATCRSTAPTSAPRRDAVGTRSPVRCDADREALDTARERGMPDEVAARLTSTPTRPPSSSPASNRPRRRSPRRASRTPPSTATFACSR